MFSVYLAVNVSPDISPEDFEYLAEQYTQEAMRFDSVWGFTSIAIGSGISLLGGYVCACFARERWKKAALILGTIVAAFSFYSSVEYYSLGASLSLGLLTLVIVYLGAWLREGRQSNAIKNN